MDYSEFKQQQQEEVNNFPMMFAFNDKQFKEGCQRLGVNNARAELYSIGAGGYIRKTDSANFNSLIERLDNEKAAALKDYNFLLNAISYELNNHEYCITGDPGPALNVLNFTLKDVKNSDLLQRALNKAIELEAGEPDPLGGYGICKDTGTLAQENIDGWE